MLVDLRIVFDLRGWTGGRGYGDKMGGIGDGIGGGWGRIGDGGGGEGG